MTMTTPEDDPVLRLPIIQPNLDDIVLRAPVMPDIEALRGAVEHDYERDVEAMRESFADIHLALSQFTEAYRRHFLFSGPDPRQGEEVYVYDLLPGARVFILEDVFTVDRVDMDAPLPTVWLKELPTSPLYFGEYEAIYLADETED